MRSTTVMPETRRTRRTALGAVGTAALAGLLGACAGPAAPSGPPAPEGAREALQGDFEFWQPWPIEQPTHGGPIGWKQLMDGFNARGGPQCRISTPAGTLERAVQTAFAAGTAPDAWQCNQTWAVVWAAQGFAAPLDTWRRTVPGEDNAQLGAG